MQRALEEILNFDTLKTKNINRLKFPYDALHTKRKLLYKI